MIEKRETIIQYIHNHLKTEESKRANLFIRILRHIVGSKFSKERFEKDAQSHIVDLLNTPVTIADIETEPIPFTDLINNVSMPAKLS